MKFRAPWSWQRRFEHQVLAHRCPWAVPRRTNRRPLPGRELISPAHQEQSLQLNCRAGFACQQLIYLRFFQAIFFFPGLKKLQTMKHLLLLRMGTHSVIGIFSPLVCACVCYCHQGCPQSFLEAEFLEATYQEGQVRKGCPQRGRSRARSLCCWSFGI